MTKTIPQEDLLVESALNVRTMGSGSTESFVEQDSKVHVVGVRSEVIRDVRDMVAGFLKDNCMKSTTGGRDDVGRISARRAWIPLKEGKSELMVHEITISCGNGAGSIGLGLSKIDHRKNHCLWFGEESCICTKIGANRVMGSR